MLLLMFDSLAREHPAFIHVPLGLVVTLPLAVFFSYRAKDPRIWIRKAFFMAAVALGGSLVALYSGLLWARQISLVPAAGYLPRITSASQVLQKVLLRHEGMAVLGLPVGLGCLWLLWRTLQRPGLRSAAMAGCLVWAGIWGATGMMGGTMVFGSEEINKAAAAADAARRADTEADLPIRALDYGSLEPVRARPFRSKAHGNHWGQVWVTASGADAYQAGKPLPAGAYAVMSTFRDAQGRPGFEPGPLLMRETRTDGGQAFIYYWPRVPAAEQAAAGGQDSVYWRSPDPRLDGCRRCHPTAAPAAGP